MWTDSSNLVILNTENINVIYNNFNANVEYIYYYPYKFQNIKQYNKIQKRNISYQSNNFNVTAGNFYISKSRNTSIGFYYDDKLLRDKYLDGINGTFDLNLLNFNFHIGLPYIKEFHNGFYNTLNDTSDLITGVGFKYKPFEWLNTGINYNHLFIGTINNSDQISNIFIHIPLNAIEFYTSLSYRTGFDRSIFITNKGLGIYSNLSFYLSAISLNIEGFYADTFDFGGSGFRYAEIPSLTYSGYSINRGMDELGTRINFLSPLNNSINMVKSNFSYITTKTMDKRLMEGFIGMTIYHNSFSSEIALNYINEEFLHSDIDLKQTLKSKFEIFLLSKIPVKFINREEFISEDTLNYLDSEFCIDITPLNNFTVYSSFVYRNKDIRNEGTLWYIGGLRFDFLEHHTLQSEFGSRKGGIVCSGGICRYEDPFNGIKIKYTFSY